jgi:hypothetical protein
MTSPISPSITFHDQSNSSPSSNCHWLTTDFGIVVTDERDGRVCVLLAEEYEHSTSEDMLSYVHSLMNKYAPVD